MASKGKLEAAMHNVVAEVHQHHAAVDNATKAEQAQIIADVHAIGGAMHNA